MKTSPNGLDLIKRFESCKLTAYRCPADVLTIGWGHTGRDVTPGLVIPQARADELLALDLVRFEAGVSKLVTTQIDQNQFDALVSFAFNVGLGRAQGSNPVPGLATSTLLKYVNLQKHGLASGEFLKWNKAGGVVLLGLVRRRKAESDLYRTPVE